MAAGAPFDRRTFEDVEGRRIAEQNRQLAGRQQRIEEQRRRRWTPSPTVRGQGRSA
jgi:hypothetical protein